MTTPLEAALQQLARTGWLLRSLGKSPFNGARPWSCELWPGHLGRYYHGRRVKNSLWTVYEGSQTTIVGDGDTPLEAVKMALALLDKSDAKAIYEDFERAFEDWLDAIETFGNRG